MRNFKCTILFNICTSCFLSCYDTSCLCLDNIFMDLLISDLLKIGAMKPIFLDSGSPRGEVFACLRMHGHGLLSLYGLYTKFN